MELEVFAHQHSRTISLKGFTYFVVNNQQISMLNCARSIQQCQQPGEGWLAVWGQVKAGPAGLASHEIVQPHLEPVQSRQRMFSLIVFVHVATTSDISFLTLPLGLDHSASHVNQSYLYYYLRGFFVWIPHFLVQKYPYTPIFMQRQN